MGRRQLWTEERIEQALRKVVAELGCMPTRDDLIDRGLQDLASAVGNRKNGAGYRGWALKLKLTPRLDIRKGLTTRSKNDDE